MKKISTWEIIYNLCFSGAVIMGLFAAQTQASGLIFVSSICLLSGLILYHYQLKKDKIRKKKRLIIEIIGTYVMVLACLCMYIQYQIQTLVIGYIPIFLLLLFSLVCFIIYYKIKPEEHFLYDLIKKKKN